MQQRYKFEEGVAALAQGHEHSVDCREVSRLSSRYCAPLLPPLPQLRQDVDQIVGDNLEAEA